MLSIELKDPREYILNNEYNRKSQNEIEYILKDKVSNNYDIVLIILPN